MIRFPAGTGPSAARVTPLVDSLDLAPTIADVFGVCDTSGRLPESFRGRSLLPVAMGAPGRAFVFSPTLGDRPRYGIRDERLWR